MKIEKNSVVGFTYEMIIIHEDGKQHKQVEKSKPLMILIDRGNLLEPFEKQLFGLVKDDSFEFTLRSDQTYGPYLVKAIHEYSTTDILKNTGLENKDIEVGIYLPMETDDGTPFNGKVVEISDDKVVLDFNHPLAGKDLLFRGKILSVRLCTPEEMETGKVIEANCSA